MNKWTEAAIAAEMEVGRVSSAAAGYEMTEEERQDIIAWATRHLPNWATEETDIKGMVVGIMTGEVSHIDGGRAHGATVEPRPCPCANSPSHHCCQYSNKRPCQHSGGLLRMKLISVTTPNAAALETVPHLANGKSTFQENIIEYAGRVCYRSTHRMGTAPNFISARIREGHEDIIEHTWVSVWTEYPAFSLRVHNRFCEVGIHDDGWIVTGNLRVWLDFFRKGLMYDAIPILKAIAPNVFSEFDATPATLPALSEFNVAPTEWRQQKVTLLGASIVPGMPSHSSATFLFEGLSRACTHQLVRHRLQFSYSMESQRYVDLEKGEWEAIIPPAIAANPEALQKLNDFWAKAEFTYGQLRKLGIRKEDARFLLPNAAETRIVATSNFDGWLHFLWLRAVDKAAQWEIRAMGQQVLAQLMQIAPETFQPVQDKWENME